VKGNIELDGKIYGDGSQLTNLTLAETDTLATVAARGATTNLAVGIGTTTVTGALTTTGSVGIGTTSPGFQFEMHGASPNFNIYRYDSSTTPAVLRQLKARGTQAVPTAVLSGDALGSFLFGGYKATAWGYNTAGIWAHAAENYTDAATGSYLAFLTTNTGAVSYTEKLRITASGNVGIGSTAPTSKLDLVGVGTTSATSALTIRDASKAAKVTVLDNGNVGIGTTNPKSRLQVAGGIQCADDTDAASVDKVGATRYRVSGNNSYCEMCMQTGAGTYAWTTIVEHNW